MSGQGDQDRAQCSSVILPFGIIIGGNSIKPAHTGVDAVITVETPIVGF